LGGELKIMNISYNNEVYQISVLRKPVLEIDNKYWISVSVVKCGIGIGLIIYLSPLN